MRIGYDATILTRRLTGIGYYTLNLVEAIAKGYPEHEIYLFAHKPLLKTPDYPNIKAVIKGSMQAHLFVQMQLPGLARRYEIDIIHGPNFYLPLSCKIPSVVTIHDLSVLLFPEFHSFLHRQSQRFLLPSVNRADAVICDSFSTASDLVKLKPDVETKVHTVHLAVDEKFFIDSADMGIVEKYSLPEEYILFVGTLEPRKNLVGLLRAFATICHKIPHDLVIAGGIGWKNTELYRTIEDLMISDRVHFAGYVNDEDLPSLYRLASVFVYPSFYEGFGLPPLEAMACGTPTVTSNTSSMPEVTGESAILIDPHCDGEIAEAIINITQDSRKAEKLSKDGRLQAGKFKWEKTAVETIKIYQKIRNLR